MMKTVVSTVVALAIAAAFVVPVPAEARTKKHRYYAKQQYRYQVDRRASNRNVPQYQEFIAEKRPFGSSSWWEQMDREGRGGQSRAN
jgi:hypothetical protein